MSHKMQGFILICIVGFLEYRYIIYATFMKIFILIYIYRIDLNTDISEIFPGNLHCFSDIFYIRIGPAFPCKDQDLFHTGLCDHLHFMLDLFKCKFFAADVVVAVKTAVNAVILAVIGNIKRGKNVYRIAKMIFCDLLSFSGHYLQIRSRCRG